MRGLEVFPGGLLQDQLVQRQVGNRPAQPGVLGLERLQPLHLVALKAAVLVPPPIVRNLRHADRPDRLADRPALPRQHNDLAQLRDDLFSRMSLPCHCSPPPWPNHTSGRTTSKGAGQFFQRKLLRNAVTRARR